MSKTHAELYLRNFHICNCIYSALMKSTQKELQEYDLYIHSAAGSVGVQWSGQKVGSHVSGCTAAPNVVLIFNPAGTLS